MARGRPSKLTKGIQEKIVECLEDGNYIETAAAFAGLSKQTIYDWIRRGARESQRLEENPGEKPLKSEKRYVDFLDAIEKAKAIAEMEDVKRIKKAALEDWKAAAWRLERRMPEKWGRREKTTVEHAGEVKANDSNIRAELDEIKDIYAELSKQRQSSGDD